MFEDLEYRHTAPIKRDAWFLKLWCWAWEMEPENADFCKLFWGYVFMPLNLFIRIVAWPIIKIIHGIKAFFGWLGEHGENHNTITYEEHRAKMKLEAVKNAENEEKKKRREDRIKAFFGHIGSAADKVVGFFQSTWVATKWIVYLIGVVLCLALAGVLIWGVVEIVGLIAGDVSGVLRVTGIVFAVIAGIVIVVAIAVGLIWAFVETPLGAALKRFFKRVFGAFGSALYTGLVAIKTRTCPKIELIEEDAE